MQDLLDEKILKKKITAAIDPKRLSLRPYAKDPSLDLQSMTEAYLTYGHRLERHIADTARIVWDALDADRIVIYEGAQGALLDIDHGTYPFVTSSNPIAGAACVGAGVGPKDIHEVWGIAKAYVDARRLRAVPDRARRRGRRGDPPPRRRVRHDDGPRAAHRLARHPRAALRVAHQRPDRAGDHEARRPVGLREDQGLHGLQRARRREVHRLPVPPVGPAPRQGRVHRARRLDRGHRRLPHGRRPAAGRARLPGLHRRADQGADRARRRRPRARAGHLDAGRAALAAA